MEYRVNLPYGSSEAIIHEVSCVYVDDAMKGPYATRGAAVDGGFLLRSLAGVYGLHPGGEANQF